MVLGNLSSDAVDPDSAKTKALVVQQGGVEALAKKLEATDWVSQMYAAAAVQNLSQDAAFATALATLNGPKKLQRLLQSHEEMVVKFAAGALKNLTDHLEAERQRERDAAAAALAAYSADAESPRGRPGSAALRSRLNRTRFAFKSPIRGRARRRVVS